MPIEKQYIYKSLLPEFNLTKKRVLLRADLNVPLEKNTILDDYRLLALLPTIDLIRKKGGEIIIATHLGRPNGHYEPSLSTKMLVPWFEKKGYSITFCPTLEQAQSTSAPLILLENLRFFPGEQNHDILFAQELASLADFYVNDAFGLLHRTDSSITLVPLLFNKEHCTIGLLIERELQALDKLIHPAHPFVVIMGGGKVNSKLPMLHHIITVADTVLLCPALIFTFMKALKSEVGNSLVDVHAIDDALAIMKEAKNNHVNLIFPKDYQVILSKEKKLITVRSNAIPQGSIGVSIGPETLVQFSETIAQAKTIFFNAAMGFADQPKTQEMVRLLLEKIAQSSAYVVVGGGDSVSAVRRFGLEKKISFLSTGGGSTLAYLSDATLPGLIAMQK